MMFSWAIAAVPFGIYTIAQHLNIPLELQPQLFLLLCLICWAQCMYYDTHWSLKKCLLVVTALCILFGGIEVGVIFAIRVFRIYCENLSSDSNQKWRGLASQDLWGPRFDYDVRWSRSAIYRHIPGKTCKRI
jgi:hypothetical protein